MISFIIIVIVSTIKGKSRSAYGRQLTFSTIRTLFRSPDNTVEKYRSYHEDLDQGMDEKEKFEIFDLREKYATVSGMKLSSSMIYWNFSR